MTRINSPLDDALRAARRDWLNSLVYSVLDTAVEYQADRDIRQEAQDYGPYLTAQMLLKSARFDPDSEPDPEPPWARVNPWEAELLLAFTPTDIVLTVEEWTNKVPLDPRIDSDHAVELAKLRRLQSLRRKLNQP
jgi:hypothetical protein